MVAILEALREAGALRAELISSRVNMKNNAISNMKFNLKINSIPKK